MTMLATSYKISSSKTGKIIDKLGMPAQVIHYQKNYYLDSYDVTGHPKDAKRPFFEYLALSKITPEGMLPVCPKSTGDKK